MDTKVYLSIDYQKLMELRKSSSFLLVLVFLISTLATSGCLEEIENNDEVVQNDNSNDYQNGNDGNSNQNDNSGDSYKDSDNDLSLIHI